MRGAKLLNATTAQRAGGKTMKRRRMTIEEIREESTYFSETNDMSAGICALVDVENMGFCKDGTTRWYYFTDENGNPAVYYKH